jgi:hypothetical protein
MQVVITKDRLVASNACPVYLDSPEWDKEQQALVYSDWDATVVRLLSTPRGTKYLGFLIKSELVPMTQAQFTEVRKGR